MKAVWQLQEAKARFSEVVERALKGEPQLVLRRGKKAVVVLDWETYARLVGEETSALEALRPPKALPNEEVEALFQRPKAGFREVEL
ncbi:type II toxin-antitoxin system prevent-host-death family antitoxin [Thermus sp.]|uniref:type II toxin-antitoxin system prevent-host-death family antitoxin n=1 Tax=Thermus sp. TaxID=275 RepID=UPI003D13AD77